MQAKHDLPLHSNSADSTSLQEALPLSLDALINTPELFIDSSKKLIRLKGKYSKLSECNCDPIYDRTYRDYFRLKQQGVITLPRGFNTPLDLFESIATELIFSKNQEAKEIHVVSLGAGQLLRDLFLLLKLVKKYAEHQKVPKITLHAIDLKYKNKEWISTFGACITQFKELVSELNLNIILQTYNSINEY